MSNKVRVGEATRDVLAESLHGYFSCYDIHDHPHLEGLPYLIMAAKHLGYHEFLKHAKEYSEGYFKVDTGTYNLREALSIAANGTPMVPMGEAGPILSFDGSSVCLETHDRIETLSLRELVDKKWVPLPNEVSFETAVKEYHAGKTIVSPSGNEYKKGVSEMLSMNEVLGAWRVI